MSVNARIQLKRDTTANWSLVHGTFVPLDGEVIIYTDYISSVVEENGVEVTKYTPGIKIGTGNAYLGDLPFITASKEEVDFWNNKLNCDENVSDELLIFNRN